MSMKVEIKFTQVPHSLRGRERAEEQTKTLELLERLCASFFPFLIIEKDGLTCSLSDFVEAVDLRESFGKNPNDGEMHKAFREWKAVHDAECHFKTANETILNRQRRYLNKKLRRELEVAES